MRRYSTSLLIALVFLGLSSCATKKKKSDKLSLAGRTYHNLTSHYNGYFNANELYKQSIRSLNEGYQDNYNQILELYPSVATDQEKSVDGDIETAIQKTSIVVKLHRKSDWTDDCYLLFGKCRYLQKDYESAQEAFEYLTAEYNLKALEKKKQGKKKKKKKKKSSKKKKEEKPEKYPLEKRPAYEDGYIWLAKTYIEREKYDDAELVITTMKNDKKTHDDMADDMAEVLAYSNLKQKNYEAALPHLEEAFDLVKSRKKKVRYAYIIAQIHQEAGRGKEAVAYFDKVLKNGPKYDMEFNARLSLITNEWKSGKDDSDGIVRKLNRMMKDSKNTEYKDRIYYTLAQVYLKDGNKNEAITALRKSLAFNQGNTAQKAESYLLLGDLYYEAEEYVNAKNYFDSTLISLNTTDDRVDRVKRMSDNLIEIAENITIIEMQDSLLAINNLSDDAKRKLAAKLLKEKKAAEAAKAKSAIPAAAASSATNKLGAAKSNFFAYDDRKLKKSKKNFEKRWGVRTLEDDWRRSNKKGGGFGTEEDDPEEIAESLSDKDIEDVFKDVPSTPAAIAQANDKIRVAMFKLGTLFRDRIENNKKSIETLEELLSRYPNTSDKLDAYYNLYLANTDLNNRPRAKYYYNKITSEYPNTTYARVLSDPNFLSEASAKEKEVSEYYDKAYALFTKNQYKKAHDMLAGADKKFGKLNQIKPKFALLSAMCLGSIEGKEAYIKALQEVVAKHATTAEGKKAAEIIRYLKGGKLPSSSKPKPGGKDPKDSKSDKEEEGKTAAEDIFKIDDNKSHYFIASLKSGALRDVKDAVSDYNQEYFSKKAYRTNSIDLRSADNTQLIIVRRFKNKADAMEYYNKVAAEKAKFLGEGADAEMFVIAQSNYREVLKAKSVKGYISFFRKNYL